MTGEPNHNPSKMIIVFGNTPQANFVHWFKTKHPNIIILPMDPVVPPDAIHIVCISTMDSPFKFTHAVRKDDPRVMHILANPNFKGFSNPEEFITMQHRDGHEGHPLCLDIRSKHQAMTHDIHAWVKHTEAAILHTLLSTPF
jgi:hypothetical protein